ncbi:unnamed protein product [Staurois parvus]|uniref:Uncharacterized protein n=1 Tax=Staurois parvus TaxID=386267 RepID=A0ABN9GLA2_9NEOB|nr:unnamed protein product [Staurois parvus]
MLLPGPESLMGPVRPHCCCVSPSHTLCMCHFQVSSHCWWVPFFVIRVLARLGSPIAAAGPLSAMGPVPILMLLPGPECVMGPCTASHC